MIERSRELVEERYSISNGHKHNAKVGMYVCRCSILAVCIRCATISKWEVLGAWASYREIHIISPY